MLHSKTVLFIYCICVVFVQSLKIIQLFSTLWTEACQAYLSPGACSSLCPLSRWCHPTISSSVSPFSSCSQSFLASGSFFSKECVLCIRWPKDWNFSISFSNEYSGLISFRMDCFDHLAVLGTLMSLPQHHSSKAPILQHSAFFMVQLSHLYMITGKIIALMIWTFVSKVMSLLFNMLYRFVIAFLPRSKCPFISWQQSPSTVILYMLIPNSHWSLLLLYPLITINLVSLSVSLFLFWKWVAINILYTVS